MRRALTLLVVGSWSCAPSPDDARVPAEGSGSEGLQGTEGPDADSSESAGPLPTLLSSTPALDEDAVYPSPLWSGDGEEVVIELAFSEPMVLTGELRLTAAEHERPIAEVVWSQDSRNASLFVRPDFSNPRPLRDETEYALDTSGFISAAGLHLDPEIGLRDGILVFTTGRFDGLLNHSCGHTFFGPFADLVAGPQPDDSAPDITTTHTQYTVALLPEESAFSGWLRATFPSVGPYRLYFDTEVTLARFDGGTMQPMTLSPTARVCPGITHEVTLHPAAGEAWLLFVGPQPSSPVHVIVELTTGDY